MRIRKRHNWRCRYLALSCSALPCKVLIDYYISNCKAGYSARNGSRESSISTRVLVLCPEVRLLDPINALNSFTCYVGSYLQLAWDPGGRKIPIKTEESVHLSTQIHLINKSTSPTIPLTYISITHQKSIRMRFSIIALAAPLLLAGRFVYWLTPLRLIASSLGRSSSNSNSEFQRHRRLELQVPGQPRPI